MIAAHPMFLDRPALVESVSPAEMQWATPELARALLSTAGWLHSQWGGRYRLTVGDISSRRGGKLARHEAHREGLDADVAYLSASPKRRGHRAQAFNNRFRETFVTNGALTRDFDLAKNYALVRHILESENVSQILVGCEIERAFRRLNPSPAEFERVVGYPGHDDHFHVRMQCSGCKGEKQSWNGTKCRALSSARSRR